MEPLAGAKIRKWLTDNYLSYKVKVRWMAMKGPSINFINWGASCIGISATIEVLQLRYEVR